MRSTPAAAVRGLNRLVGPLISVHLGLFCFVVSEPLLRTRFLFFSRHDISLATAALELYGTDLVLFLVVFVFGILAPLAKLIAFAWVWYFVPLRCAGTYNGFLVLVSRVAMTDVMLIALLVVCSKGVPAASLEVRPGLYFYVLLVLGSFGLSIWFEHQIRSWSQQI